MIKQPNPDFGFFHRHSLVLSLAVLITYEDMHSINISLFLSWLFIYTETNLTRCHIQFTTKNNWATTPNWLNIYWSWRKLVTQATIPMYFFNWIKFWLNIRALSKCSWMWETIDEQNLNWFVHEYRILWPVSRSYEYITPNLVVSDEYGNLKNFLADCAGRNEMINLTLKGLEATKNNYEYGWPPFLFSFEKKNHRA